MSAMVSLPVMAGASLLEGVRFFSSGPTPSPHEVFLLLLGGGVAFLTSLCVIRFLLGFVERHRFSVFGLYRIVLGAILLVGVIMLAIVDGEPKTLSLIDYLNEYKTSFYAIAHFR